jgi:hypothetical protein
MVIVTKSDDKLKKVMSLQKREELSSRSEDGIKGVMLIGKNGQVLKAPKMKVMKMISIPKDDKSESSNDNQQMESQHNIIKASKRKEMEVVESISARNDNESEVSNDDDTLNQCDDDFSDQMERCFVIEEISGMAKRNLKSGGMKDVFNLVAMHPNGQRRVMSVWGSNGISTYKFFM